MPKLLPESAIIPNKTYIATQCNGKCNSVQLHEEKASQIRYMSGKTSTVILTYTCQNCGSIKVMG